MKLKSPEKEHKIKDALVHIVFESGLSSVKISKIATEAGVAQGTVYLYFNNKSELINETFKTHKLKASKLLSPKNTADLSYEEAFQFLWKTYFEYLINYKKEIHFMQQCIVSNFLTKNNQNISINFMDDVNSFFKKGIKNKSLKNYPTNLMIAMFTGFAKELTVILGNKKPTKKELNNAIEMCWSALKK